LVFERYEATINMVPCIVVDKTRYHRRNQKKKQKPRKNTKKKEMWIKCTPNVSGETLVGEKFNMRRHG
jgi:hypothetical protein